MRQQNQIIEYKGNKITFLSGENVMVNATQMAKLFNKRPGKWLELPSTTSFLNTLSAIRESDSGDNLIVTKSGGTIGGGGTWMHEEMNRIDE